MSNLYWLSDTQMAKPEPFFPKPHGKPRVDDRRVLIGIIFINRNGLRWCDAPAEYGPHKTLYSRWKRWSEKGIFAQMLLTLSDQGGGSDTLMIDATQACIPSRKGRKTHIPHDETRYRKRHKIENSFARLKDWRRVATRYDRCPKVFLSACALAAVVMFWL